MVRSNYRIKIGTKTVTSQTKQSEIYIKRSMWMEPTIFEVSIYGMNETEVKEYTVGSNIKIEIGGIEIFDGVIRSVVHKNFGRNMVLVMTGIDSHSFQLNNKEINKSYSQELVGIVSDLVSPLTSDVSNDLISKEMDECYFQDWSAWNALEWLSRRYNAFFYSDGKRIIMSTNPTNPLEAGSIKSSDTVPYHFRPIKYVLKDGYTFVTEGDPTITVGTPISIAEIVISGLFSVVKVEHYFETNGKYTTKGVIIPFQNFTTSDIEYFVKKTDQTFYRDLMDDKIELSPSIMVGKVNRYTAGSRNIAAHTISLNLLRGAENFPEMTKHSFELQDTDVGVSLTKKEIISPLAVDGAGIIYPYYPGQRVILAKVGNQKDDLVIIGTIWKKGMARPAHNEGDFLEAIPVNATQNAQRLVSKSGENAQAYKTMSIKIGDNQLKNIRVTPVDEDLLPRLGIDPYSGVPVATPPSDLELRFDSESNFNSIARKGDKIISNSVLDNIFWTFLTTHTHPTAPTGPISPPTPPYPASLTGRIEEGSNNANCG